MSQIESDSIENIRRQMLRAVRTACPCWLASHAEDITQNAMIKLLRVLQHRGEEDQSLPLAYLRKIAYHAVVDEIRSRRGQFKHEVLTEEEEAPEFKTASVPDPEQEHRLACLQGSLQQSLSRLKEKRRVAVVLHLQGHTVPEIARLLGCSRSKANNRVYRGLRDVRKRMRTGGWGLLQQQAVPA